MTLEEKRKYRLLFLKKLYEDSDGNRSALIEMYELGKEIGIPREAIRGIVQYLDGEGLLQIRTLDGKVSITHSGVLEIEEAIGNPNAQTDHFPPINIINVNSMENSVIQQGSPGAIQQVNFNAADFEQIRKIVSEIIEKMDGINLSSTDLMELSQEIETIKIQLASPKPKSIILNESLKTIRDLLLSVTGSVYTPLIIEWINKILNG